MDSRSEIGSFIGHFRQFLGRMEELPADRNLILLKKLGIVAALDGLSKVGCPQESGNRARFVGFISRFSGWQDSVRISLPHLSEALAGETRPEFEQLKCHADDLLKKWPTSPAGPRNISSDPMPEEVLSLWPVNDGRLQPVLGKICPEDLCHGHLLYAYRNCLAHELRESGWGTIESGVSFAYYLSTSIRRFDGTVKRKRSWLLHYPLMFFCNLADESLLGLEEWLRAEKVDPYKYYEVSESWLGQLLEGKRRRTHPCSGRTAAPPAAEG